MDDKEYAKRQTEKQSITGPDVVISMRLAEQIAFILTAVNQSGEIHLVNDSYFLRQSLEHNIDRAKD
jgi:hypothetical protein